MVEAVKVKVSPESAPLAEAVKTGLASSVDSACVGSGDGEGRTGGWSAGATAARERKQKLRQLLPSPRERKERGEEMNLTGLRIPRKLRLLVAVRLRKTVQIDGGQEGADSGDHLLAGNCLAEVSCRSSLP